MPTKLSRLPAGDPEDGEEEEEGRGDPSAILWTGAPRRTPIICFHPEAILTKEPALRSTGERYRLAYKMVRTDSRLVRGLLSAHGFHEVNANSNDFNLMWTGSHVKPHVLRGLASFQKVNHFPRSYELTRKDRLYKNVQRMQQTHGQRHFNLLPQTYLLPGEYQEFCNAFSKDRGPWIVKPVASSRGRGVYLVNSPSQVSMEDNILVSRYLSNPLLIDGFKFDVRLYVLITSYDPLVIYLYEEGLTRFATVRYDRTPKNIKNQFMHLTNYSVNKKSGDYVSCDDPEVEDYGNKWSMSAMLRYLKQEGKDTEGLMSQVEDLIIKTIISGELHIASACKAFLPHRGNCFELYGFDVLIDNNMKPWLLEVNLSPSLACDAPLDLKVKACVIADMLTLVGLECQDPQQRPGRVGGMASNKKGALKSQKQRPLSASDIDTELQPGTRTKTESWTRATLGLSTEEVKVLRRVQEEAARRGGFVRIFPRADTWALYGSFLEYKTSMNHMLATRLFPDRTTLNHSRDHRPKIHAALYERKLVSLQMRRARKHRAPRRRGLASESSEEEEEEGEEDNSEEEVEEIPEPPPLEAEVAPLALPPAPPRVSILEALQKGENLSKVQARWAFSTYLQRVQNRLQSKVEPEKPPPKEEEQMELVMRFLQRAASNLQQSLPLRLPARSASTQEKRHLLARQLGDFITLYNQETHQMSPAEPPGVNSADFQAFIDGSSECELEEVLTFYTHKNKSASIFLGSSVPRGGQQAGDQDRRGESADLRSGQQGGSPSQNVEGGGSHAISSASVSVTKVSSDLSAGLHSGPPSIQNEQRASSPTKGSSLFSSANSDAWVQPVSRPSSTTSTLGTISSFQSAAQIYSQRLSRPSSSRPASGQSSALRTRCRSAGTVRGELEDPYNVGAVTASLQRLAERQASRQTFSQLRQLTQQLTHLNLTSKVRIHQASAPMPRGRMAAHTAAEHTDPGARNGTQEARLAWDSETESSTCPPLPGAPSAAASNLPPAGQSQGTDQSARLQPTPPPAQRGIVSRKLSASRLVRVAIPEGHHPAAEAGDTGCLTQGAPESPQMIFARSRPPVPPRTTIRMLKKDATVIHLR